MSSESDIRLVADIGGTNARFALYRPGHPPGAVTAVKTRDYPTPEDAIRSFLNEAGAAPKEAAIAVACPLSGDKVRLTNSPWEFSLRALKAALGLRHLGIYNDFAAMALSLPWLGEGDRKQIGGAVQEARPPVALVGPGTGLGVSALLPGPDGAPTPLASEGGHVGFAPADGREDAILKALRRKLARVSAERVLSGMGIENLYAAIGEIGGKAPEPLPAPEITALAREGDPLAIETFAVFSRALGSFAGDMVLGFGAWGGLFIGGGIVMKLESLFDVEAFNRRFEGKGRYEDRMKATPRWIITRDNPALLGLARELDRVCGTP